MLFDLKYKVEEENIHNKIKQGKPNQFRVVPGKEHEHTE